MHLAEASSQMLLSLLKILNIQTPIRKASALEVEGKKEELVLNICKSVQASEYLSGPDGKDYLHPELWQEHQVELDFHDYLHPQYPQLHGDFLPYMSVVDLLFNCGPDSLTILKN